MEKSGQKQSSGDDSTNLQAGGSITIVNAGLTVEEATELALGLIRPEFELLKNEAKELAVKRAEEMVTRRLLPRLVSEHREGIGTFADPDVQYALAAAERSYARTGDSEMADILVDILIDRTRQIDRTVLQISLNEALDVASKLTTDQFALLSLVWMLKYTRTDTIRDLGSLSVYIKAEIVPYIPSLRTTLATFQHLEYAGCGSMIAGGESIEQTFLRTYPGIFRQGFTEEALTNALLSELAENVRQLLVPCLHNPDLLQVDAVTEDEFLEKANVLGLDDRAIAILTGLSRHILSLHEVKTILEQSDPMMKELLEVWTKTGLFTFSLTSVGIVIAHANCRRVLGESPADLSIWIN
jgi:hypothetical protein